MPELSSVDPTATYAEVRERSRALLADGSDARANAAHPAALMFCALADPTRASCYFLRETELTPGPVQGGVACLRIARRGTCVQRRETHLEADVHALAGAQAGDAASQSAILPPLMQWERVRGVWDLARAQLECFAAADAARLESRVRDYRRASEASKLPP
jgi:L-methionine (R)-S-oxide reductase